MKIFTFSMLLLATSVAINAQNTYEVGEGKTYATIKEAVEAATAAEASGASYTINVAAGTYGIGGTEKDIRIQKAQKATIIGAGADVTEVTFSETDVDFMADQLTTHNLGRIFPMNSVNQANVSLTVKNISFSNMGFSNKNGGAVVNTSQVGQEVIMENCNFKNIFARMGAIAQFKGGSSLTFRNCFFENCGTIDNQDRGGLIQVESGAGVIENCAFINCAGEAINRGLDGDNANADEDGNYRNGALILIASAAESLEINNCNFIGNKYVNGETTNYHPLISIRKGSVGTPDVTIKNSIMLNSLRAESNDCDILCTEDVNPVYENNVMAKLVTFKVNPEVEGQLLHTANPEKTGCTYVEASFSLADYFEMEGDMVAVTNGENGEKQLIRKDIPSSTLPVESFDAKIITRQGMVLVSTDEVSNIAIYSITGVKIYDVKNTMQLQAELNNGIYIVSVNNKTTKVYVK